MLSQFEAAKEAIHQRYPAWKTFIEELMSRIKPFYLNEHDRDKAHFIHLIRSKSQSPRDDLIRELLALLKWSSKSYLITMYREEYESEKLTSAREFQKAHRHFPQVLVTDYLNGLFSHLQSPSNRPCRIYDQVESFLKERKSIDLINNEGLSSNAEGSLIIHYLHSFDDDEDCVLEMVQFAREKKIQDPETLKKCYIPKRLSKALEKGLVHENELLFYSEDQPLLLTFSFDLAKVVERQEQAIAKLTGMQTSFSDSVIQHFLQSLKNETPTLEQLDELFQKFLNPLIEDVKESLNGKTISIYRMQLDFQNEWFIHLTLNKPWKEELFLKKLPGLSHPAPSLGIEEEKFGKHLIALGTAAGRFVSEYRKRLSFDSITIVDKQQFNCFDSSLCFQSFSPSEEDLRKIREVDSSSPFLEGKLEFSKELQEYFRSLHGELVFYVGLGRTTGNLLAKMLADSLADSNLPIKVVATLPLNFEGTKPEMRAKAIADFLTKSGLGNSILPLEHVVGQSLENKMQSLFGVADRNILKYLNSLE